MRRYVTISVPVEVKRILERAKGGRERGEFLLSLYMEAKALKGRRAFEELRETLSEEELDGILSSSEEFRRRFSLR